MTTHTATFALGCFWGPDARFGLMPGVLRSRVGYAGGTVPAPTYRTIGDHYEVVEVDFDPEQLPYPVLVERFFAAHDPTKFKAKKQYRSAVLTRDEAQLDVARRLAREEGGHRDAEIRTVIKPLDAFHWAEDDHQKWRLRRYEALTELLVERLGDERAFACEPAISRLNGYAGGYGDPDELRAELAALDLPETPGGPLTEELIREHRIQAERRAP